MAEGGSALWSRLKPRMPISPLVGSRTSRHESAWSVRNFAIFVRGSTCISPAAHTTKPCLTKGQEVPGSNPRSRITRAGRGTFWPRVEGQKQGRCHRIITILSQETAGPSRHRRGGTLDHDHGRWQLEPTADDCSPHVMRDDYPKRSHSAVLAGQNESSTSNRRARRVISARCLSVKRNAPFAKPSWTAPTVVFRSCSDESITCESKEPRLRNASYIVLTGCGSTRSSSPVRSRARLSATWRAGRSTT
jgi:hypothetical protein